MSNTLPSYIANDAAPLFPDVTAMSHEEFINYESPPERLAFYRLHTEEGLKAFLHDVYWIGYPVTGLNAIRIAIARSGIFCT